MKYSCLVIFILCTGLISSAQQAATASAATSATIISPVGISIEKYSVQERMPKHNSGVQKLRYKLPAKTLPEVLVSGSGADYGITVKEEEPSAGTARLFRVTVHFD